MKKGTSRRRRSRSFRCLAAMATMTMGCVHSYGMSGAGVTPIGNGRTAGTLGLSVRSDWRLPRMYVWYFMTEAAASSQLITTESPLVAARAGHNRPAERVGIGLGQIRIAQAGHAIGFRGGLRFDLWHGSLGDTQSAWMGSFGLECGPIIPIESLVPPWQADSTATAEWVILPTAMALGGMRFDRPEQSRFAVVYALTISIGVQLSSSLVP